MSTELAKINNASVSRQEFGVQQLEVIRETASTAIAAREKATVEARYVMALQRPRNIEKTRQELLRACSYVEFAEAAWFDLKKHNKGEGFTIRFAEEAIRALGNVYPEMAIVYESPDIRIVRVTVTDLEANVPYSTEIVVPKRIEKKKLSDGQIALSERLNSKSEKVFLVDATDDEILKSVNNQRSKAFRTDGLRLVPAWLKAECRVAIFKCIRGDIDKDPALARRAIIDGFAGLGIPVEQLAAYLKPMSIETVTPAVMVDLRLLYKAIANGEITWQDAMEDRHPKDESSKPPTDNEKNGSAAKAAKVAEEKLAEIRRETAGKGEKAAEDKPLTPEEMDRLDAEARAKEAEQEKRTEEPKGTTKGFNFGAKK